MKAIIFSLIFMALIASAVSADGLKITRIDARVDYDDSYIYRLEQAEKLTRANNALVPLTDGSKINVDVFPGSNLTFTITVENTFKGVTPEIRNIFAKISIQGKGKEGNDLTEKSTDFSIDAGNDLKADIKFKIPFEIESGPHNVLIEVHGIGNNTLFQTSINLKLDIKKLGHDLRISKISLDPSSLSCTRTSTLTAEIANAGANNEDNIDLEFKVPSIGLDIYDRGISLSASNDDPDHIKHTKTAKIEIPAFFEPGKYPVFVNLHWNDFVVFDQKIIDLEVKSCGSAVNKTESNKNINNQTPATQAQTTEVPKEGIVTTIESDSILNSPIALMILAGNGILIAVILILVVFGLLKRSRV